MLGALEVLRGLESGMGVVVLLVKLHISDYYLNQKKVPLIFCRFSQ